MTRVRSWDEGVVGTKCSVTVVSSLRSAPRPGYGLAARSHTFSSSTAVSIALDRYPFKVPTYLLSINVVVIGLLVSDPDCETGRHLNAMGWGGVR